MEAMACCLSQFSVGVSVHFVVVSVMYMVGGLLVNTPSRLLFPQSAGAA